MLRCEGGALRAGASCFRAITVSCVFTGVRRWWRLLRLVAHTRPRAAQHEQHRDGQRARHLGRDHLNLLQRKTQTMSIYQSPAMQNANNVYLLISCNPKRRQYLFTNLLQCKTQTMSIYQSPATQNADNIYLPQSPHFAAKSRQ